MAHNPTPDLAALEAAAQAEGAAESGWPDNATLRALGFSEPDAAYIAAANPATVLALIAALRQQQAECEQLRSAISAARGVGLVTGGKYDRYSSTTPNGAWLASIENAGREAVLSAMDAALGGQHG